MTSNGKSSKLSVPSTTVNNNNNRGQKRSRDSNSNSDAPTPAPIRKSSTKSTNPNTPTDPSRRIDSVIFSGFEIQAEFNSPYPFEEPVVVSKDNHSNTAGERKNGGGGSRNVNSVVSSEGGSSKKGSLGEGSNAITTESVSSSSKAKGKRKESPLVVSSTTVNQNNNNNNSKNTVIASTSTLSTLLNTPLPSPPTFNDELPTRLILASRVPIHTFDVPDGTISPPTLVLPIPPIPVPITITEPIHRTRRASSTASTSRSTPVPLPSLPLPLPLAPPVASTSSNPIVTITSSSSKPSISTLKKKPSIINSDSNTIKKSTTTTTTTNKSHSSPHPHPQSNSNSNRSGLASTPGSVPFIEIEVRSKRYSSSHRVQSSPLTSNSKVKPVTTISTSTIGSNSTKNVIVQQIKTRRKSLQEIEDVVIPTNESSTVVPPVMSEDTIMIALIPKLDKGKAKEELPVDEQPIPYIPLPIPSTSTSKSKSTKPSTSISNSLTSTTTKSKVITATEPTPPRRLFVCDYCFKYMLQGATCVGHMKLCTFAHPPGKKVYSRGEHTIWEVDGATAKLYCQNLCLFAKLFIEHKYMFFDVEGFLFYVLTKDTPSHSYAVGYFSKEKTSYDDYNLACIVTFPPYQKQAFGSLLIEFSYELTRRFSSTPGTPERPLSELGERGYLAFWTSTLVRYFRTVLESRFDATGGVAVVEKEDEDRSSGVKNKRVKRVASKAELPSISTTTTTSTSKVQPKVTAIPLAPLIIPLPSASTSMIVTLSSSSSSTTTPQVSTTPLGSPSSTTLTLRRSASGIVSASFQPPSSPTIPVPSTTLVDIIPEVVPPIVVVEKGWARPEVQSLRLVLKPPSRAGSPSLIIKSSSTTSSTSNLNNQILIIEEPIIPIDPDLFTRKFGLEEIALAVNLRVEDVAFALVESGLASWRRRERHGEEDDDVKDEVKDGEGDVEMKETSIVEAPKIEVKAAGGVIVEEKKVLDEIVISRDLLEEVAEKFKVKDPLLDRSFVLI